MEPDELMQHIEHIAGEPLAMWMLEYALDLIKKEPTRVVENGAALMLMGYLIRDAEYREVVSAIEKKKKQPELVA